VKSNWQWLGIASLALVVLTLLAGIGVFNSKNSGGADNAIKVYIASSSTKKEWVDDSVKAFNAASKSDAAFQVAGQPVRIEVILEEIEPGKFDHYRSGTMVTDTLSGKIKPTVVSPAEETWIAKLNSEWKNLHGAEISTGKPSPLVRTPLVIAMWQSRATAMGCFPAPGPDCTWKHLSELAASPDGWGMLGHPEWGKFKFGYGYVGESNSGTLTAALLCMAGANKLTGLVVEDVDPGSGCGQMIATVEKAKVHSGKKSDWLLGWMQTGGPDYLDAVTSYEQDVIEFNIQNDGKLREPLVAAYPQDGTVVVEHPYAILDGAEWVTPQQVKAAELFRGYLLSAERQAALPGAGLRPADPAAKVGSPIEPRYGANSNAFLLPVVLPDVLVMDRITEVWHRNKKHAVIALVFDKSGSMEGEKLTTALAGAKAFVEAMDPEDQLIWIPFDETVFQGTQGLKSQIGERLVGDISSTTAGGGTALYEAIARAYRQLQAERQTLGTSVRYGIVVLSDGMDTSSRSSSLASIEAMLMPAENDPTGVQIHTIGIGKDADKAVLTRIATSAHGKYWDAREPDRAVDAYRQIAVYY
jgi:Ca-activated chloride channel family protein